MTVDDLRKILNDFPAGAEVLITDGFKGNCYRGQYEVQVFVDDDGKMCCDIGIGGCDE